ncbi:RTA1 domain protein [Penicillium alfredii]|uniref:RTA1 domain protein n=1 Tax=Penicillium alfredii TaxID=1506179 RepID=A0A9W9ER91_9EURO|nr:RTA1 domain protein [Penicillium alfredii]KAJ5086543.1 RTA1 domain protein [Penicillium alfredii]
MDITVSENPDGSIHVEYYSYVPSAPAAWAFVVLFGITTVAHFFMMFPMRAAYFIPLILGGICEAFGYYGRSWSHRKPDDMKPWIMQELLILCAPPLISATIYMILGRIIRSLQAEHHSMVRTKWLTAIFVLNDIVCFCTQIGGAGVQITGDDRIMKIGQKAVLGGLILSLVVYLLFIATAARFHVRLAREPTPIVRDNPRLRWRRYLVALYVECVAVFLRNLVRAIEYSQGTRGFIADHEAMLYVFDAFLMFLTLLLLLGFHPGLLIKRARRVASSEGVYGTLLSEGVETSQINLAEYNREK